jgi:anti-anti-sigma factor
VVSATSGRFPPGDVDAAAMAAWVRGEMRLAEGTGDPRVRVVTEMPEPLRGAAAAEQALAYERAIDAVVRETGAIALCRYDARLFGADAMAAAARAHRRVVSQRSQEVLGTPVMALLIVTRGDEGTFSVDGEVDASNIAEFEAALTMAVAGLSELVADLARVRFMDLTAVRALERQAERLGEAGGRLVLQSPPRFVERVMEILGVEGRVPLVVRHPPAGDRPSLNPPAP